MRSGVVPTLEWVILTMGDRPEALQRAIESIRRFVPEAHITILWNGAAAERLDGVEHVEFPTNVGIPAGRDLAVRRSDADIIVFLDDDAELRSVGAGLVAPFGDDPRLAVMAARIVDEDGATARRHVPRAGRRGVESPGDVATFLGGACAIRRSAYLSVGGYWPELWYGHEELDLAWRLIDADFRVRYDPRVLVFHPRTEIARHERGWRQTGRNRVWVARRNLPWPIALVHTSVWLIVGAWRAQGAECRRSYAQGWISGWRGAITRRPISWRTAWRLTLLGRTPFV